MRFMRTRDLPIGIQTFEDIISNKRVYIDKTEYVYKLVRSGKAYFLSRPRRFGKSLFVSTLTAYFEGKKKLFKNLDLYKLEKSLAKQQKRKEWLKYPIISLDFNNQNYKTLKDLEDYFDYKLSELEKEYDCNSSISSISLRFENILKSIYAKEKRPVVILVDEYDKPLLSVLSDTNLLDDYRAVLKAFFSNIKTNDRFIKFVFITGITRFDKVSIFSDLNNLNDISSNFEFCNCCGITQEELEKNFIPEIKALCTSENLTQENCLKKLKQTYDGYKFNSESDGIYNPFSLMNSFYKKSFDFFWFESGTPTYLVNLLDKSNYNISKLDSNITIDEKVLAGYRLNSENPIPMLFQTGYLTIKNYDKISRHYTLGFPNDEVKYGFINFLLPHYTRLKPEDDLLDIWTFSEKVKNGDIDGFMERIKGIFEASPKPSNQKEYELNCQSFIWLIFKLMGQFILCEVQNGNGRSDAVVWTDNYIYLFEFKMDSSAQTALDQINSKNYSINYKTDKRQLIKIGVNYSSQIKNITQWLVEK